MRTHKKLVLTEKTLVNKYGACGDIENYRHLLPATISTDPVVNLDLAKKLINAGGLYRLQWLAMVLVGDDYCIRGDDYNLLTRYNQLYTGGTYGTWIDDPWVTAQCLAFIADKYFGDRGR